MQLVGVFEACLRDLKGLLAATRKQILQPILILTISPLKLIFFLHFSGMAKYSEQELNFAFSFSEG